MVPLFPAYQFLELPRRGNPGSSYQDPTPSGTREKLASLLLKLNPKAPKGAANAYCRGLNQSRTMQLSRVMERYHAAPTRADTAGSEAQAGTRASAASPSTPKSDAIVPLDRVKLSTVVNQVSDAEVKLLDAAATDAAFAR